MNRYEIILDVCETGSISRTAEKFSYTQSAVSQTIKTYEEEIGMKLFNRSKKGMQLRADAGEIIASLQKICKEEHYITEYAASVSALDHGDLRIGTIQSISYSWLPDILRRFSEDHPNIRFTLTMDGFHVLRRKLENGDLDCIFTSEYAVTDSNFLPLWKDELLLAMPKEHRLSTQLSVTVQDIDREPYLLSSDALDYETGKIFRDNGITPDIRYSLNDDYTVANLIEHGYGISVLSKLLLSRAPFDVCIRPFKAHYYRTLGVAYPIRERQSRALTHFLESVQEWKTGSQQKI